MMRNNWMTLVVPVLDEVIDESLLFMKNFHLMVCNYWTTSIMFIESSSMSPVVFFKFGLFFGVLLFCDVMMFLFNSVSFVMVENLFG